MLNILTVKWGTKYDARYVNNLYEGICKFSGKYPFTFHCFTDNPEGLNKNIVIQALPEGVPIWWNKLYLFSKDMPVTGSVLYIDLDTVIVDNIEHILMFSDTMNIQDKTFMMLQDVYHPERWGSGIMAWHANGQYDYLWSEFKPRAMEIAKAYHPYGDQEWIRKYLKADVRKWQELYPNEFSSLKVNCIRYNKKPPKTKIVFYHGKPSIEESLRIPNFTWIGKYWNEDT